MDSFYTLNGSGSARIEIKQSVFIGQAVRIYSPEQAQDFVSSVKSQYADARHNCYAWVFSSGTKMQKYSDDGEPSGTAGLPLLSVIEKNNLRDTAIVVTRYFGGILLGKGGLVRAYTDAAAAAVRDAGIVRIDEGVEYLLRFGYDQLDRIQHMLNSKSWTISDTAYSECIELKCICPSSQSEELIAAVTDLSSGRISPEKLGVCELPQSLNQSDV